MSDTTTPVAKPLSQEFMALLQQNAEEFKKAEVISDWMPPDGDYTVIGGAFSHGTVSKDGQPPFGWFKLAARINAVSNPELHDKLFTMLYGTTKQVGLLKSAASQIAGFLVEDIMQVPAILTQADGVVYSVSISTNKKGYKRVDVTRIHK